MSQRFFVRPLRDRPATSKLAVQFFFAQDRFFRIIFTVKLPTF